jgi:hypothetical protein
MSLWNLKNDKIEHGQWVHAKIHERRCDLSPGGSLLIYFAANYGRSIQTWTAISRPPYFTALAFWPKGDSWGGGGLFETPRSIWLNHSKSDSKHDPSRTIPGRFQIRCERGGHGEIYPILGIRLKRDGWKFLGESSPYKNTTLYLWHKKSPRSQAMLEMKSYSTSNQRFSRGRGCYFEEYVLINSGGTRIDLPKVEWAAWDHRGRLLMARDGGLYVATRFSDDGVRDKLIEDFTPHRHESIPPPPSASKWPR